jgi:DNA-binding MarR family transcriptional regulator
MSSPVTTQPDVAQSGATAPGGSIPGAANKETGFLLRLAHARATAQLNAALPTGLVPRYHEVLAALAELGPSSQQHVAERLRINRTTMVSLIDSMEQDGLVQRNRDLTDRRSYALACTAKGTSALAAMESAADQADAQLTSTLNDREKRQLDRLLRTVASTRSGFDQRPAALTRRTVELLSLAHHAVSHRLAQRLKAVGLTPPLYGVLRTLDAGGPSTQQAIAEQLGLSGTAILQTVDRLEADQLVKRRRNPNDRRSYALELTSKGHDVIGQVATALQALSAELDNALGGSARQQELRRLLLKLLVSAPT